MDHEFGGYNSCSESVAGPMHSWEGSDCAVGEGVWQGAHADHDEEFEAIVLERQGERSEALVVCDEAVDKVFEDGAREDKGGGAACDGCCCGDEPAEVMSAYE